jgi:delta8-fatty-acid desaturase
MGLFWQQSAFLGHDLCHNSVFQSRKVDGLLAAVLSATSGISAQWWKFTHNVHHVVTNSIEKDPDIQHLPVFAISELFFKGFFSKHHGRFLPFDRVARFLVSYQHLTFYPIMAVGRVNLYLQSILLHLHAKEKIAYRWIDFGALVFFWIWYLALISVMPSYYQCLLYVFLSHAVSGILHVQITISHFAMPPNLETDDISGPGDFLRVQFEHSMDVDCHPWLDWFHGGLQFQVIHHLFPRLPRHNLRAARDKVMEFTAKHGIVYAHSGFVECNRKVLENLKDIAGKARHVRFDEN